MFLRISILSSCIAAVMLIVCINLYLTLNYTNTVAADIIKMVHSDSKTKTTKSKELIPVYEIKVILHQDVDEVTINDWLMRNPGWEPIAVGILTGLTPRFTVRRIKYYYRIDKSIYKIIK